MKRKIYDPKKIEPKWQKYWLSKGIFVAKESGLKEMVLIEFPYPSGAGLHMGHMRPFIAGDVVSKFWKLRGKNVMYPIGWDAFGLPAENYAIKNKVHPAVSTAQNIKNAKRQLLSWGTGFDWSREINTTDPNYYKWTQKLFLEFYKTGLAYEKFGEINWCPKDMTGLANEEVVDGKCDRCGATVEKKSLRQWYLKITDYAEKLLEGLKGLPEWPNAIKLQQENWICKSEGAEIDFRIADTDKFITVFTTRADTIFGATYLVLAPEHPWVEELIPRLDNPNEIRKYIESTKGKTDAERTADGKEKTGVELKGLSAINPATNEKIPIWISDYVLANYGTGAIMAVPAHDERDFAFAKKYKLSIKQVIMPYKEDVTSSCKPRIDKKSINRNSVVSIVKHWTDDKYAMLVYKAVNWRTFVGGGVEQGEGAKKAALREAKEETGLRNLKYIGEGSQMTIHYYNPIKDLNRIERFTPVFINAINGESDELASEEKNKHDLVWIKRENIEKFLNFDPLNYDASAALFSWRQYNSPSAITEDGTLINSSTFDDLWSEEAKKKITEFVGGKIVTRYKLRDWVFSRQRYWGEPIPLIHCSKCGIVPVPEKDLPVKLPNVKKYEPTGTGESPLAAVEKWVNTKCPNCKGKAKRETNTMPQWAGSSWYWLRYMDPKNKKEFASLKKQRYWSPVDLYFGGMEHTTLHLLYSRFWNLFLYDRGLVAVKEPYKKRVPHGIILAENGDKMSKSKGNVVSPDDLVKLYGADTVRLYMMFLGPHGAQVAWSDKGIVGCRRFLERVWAMQELITKSEPRDVTISLHKTIKKVTEDIADHSFNTAVSAMMIFVNTVYEKKSIGKRSYKLLLVLLSLFAPHMTEELWSDLGEKRSIYLAKWPSFDADMLVSDSVVVAVQINGKTRSEIEVFRDISDKEVEQIALKDEKVKSYVQNRIVKRVIVIKNRLINIVLE